MVAKGDNTRVKRSYSEYEGKSDPSLWDQVPVRVICHTRELAYQISKEDESFSKFLPTIKQAIRTTRRTGSSLILEPKWFAGLQKKQWIRQLCGQIRSKFVGSSTCTSDMLHQRACPPGCGPTWGIIEILSLIFVLNTKGKWNVSEKGSCTSKRF